MEKTELEKLIDAVAAEEILVATNEGTYGAAEACRAVGCGAPEFAAYKIYERVGGGEPRVQGADPDQAPGRRIEYRRHLVERRQHLADLRRQLAAVE